MKIRHISSLIALVLLCTTTNAVIAAEDIILRTSVTPEDAWVGQKILLHVDVLAKEGWSQLRKVSDVEVKSAYLMRLESQGTRLSETIEGDSYTGQRYEFLLFAQRPGSLTIPPTTVDVEIKIWGAGGGSRIERMVLPPVEFVARTPPGAEDLRGLISTSSLTAKQNWDRETTNLTVGDAIRRRISFRAEDVSGMAFAPMRYGDIEGLGIYPGEPAVEDKFARGDLTGTRVETVTYVFEHSGDIEIPGIDLAWWDIAAQELKHIALPGLKLNITSGQGTAQGTSAQAEKQTDAYSLWPIILSLLLIVVAVLAAGRRTADLWAEWQKARNESEAMYFRHVKRSARSGDQAAVLRDTMRWLDRINDGSRPMRLDQFLQQHGDARSQESMSQEVIPIQSKSGITAFVSILAAARKRWLQVCRSRKCVTEILPDLNGNSTTMRRA